MRSPVLPLTWHLTRASGRRGLQSQLLAASAAAVGSLVLLVLLAAYLGAGSRADRTAWRTPEPARHGTAVQALATTYVRDRPVTVVSLAQLPGRPQTPAPPGLAAFPRAGEVYVSPALARLMHDLPASRLADRFPHVSSYGAIGTAGLASPDELVAVVGRAPTDPAVSKAADGGGAWDQQLTARAVVSGFSGFQCSLFTLGDQTVVLLGAGLLVVPVVVLAAAAGRLGAARREQRLAALRLAGAAPRQILAMTGVETAVVGTAGALAGALVYTALLPALAQIPFGIGRWYTDQLWVGLPWLAAIVIAVAGVTSISAMSMLHQVATAPLGVAQQSNPRRTRLIRVVVFGAAIAYIYASSRGSSLDNRQTITLVLLFYGAFWLFGPWVVDRLGRIMGRFARRPATLLAARRLSDDPRGAWRTVSGLVLAGFVAGFFTVGHLSATGSDFRGQIALPTTSTTDTGRAAAAARTVLREAGVTASLAPQDDNWLLGGNNGLIIRVSGGPADIDTAVTALTPLAPSRLPYGEAYANAESTVWTERLADVGTATLTLGFVVAAASAGLTAAANVLDRRRVYGLMRLSGAPLKVLDTARIRETVLPLVVLAGGTTAIGVWAGYQVDKMADASISASGAVQLGLCVTLGALAMFAAIGASKPLLRRVTADPAQTAD
ncbi:FtsX-like permease family protein [Streptomyces arenae]|uniref:FtsX-like permease family protein n=1 Tax=Streptomyces arenae TaxID=29301 RepID=UPI002658BEF0|nr:FtsX-like permease family protein [Streptomyces arenae]MCG7202635.1 ABC transporter permease [Streptomyces arenae]